MPNEEVKAAIEERNTTMANLDYVASYFECNQQNGLADILYKARDSYANLFDKAYPNGPDKMLY